MFAPQHMAAPGRDDVQAVARVAQHLLHPPAIEGLQVLAEPLAHMGGRGTFFAGGQLVVLVDVVVFQPFKRRH